MEGALDAPQPSAALHLDAAEADRTSGGLAGPITVSTTATSVKLTAQPPTAAVTDRDGKPLGVVASGSHATSI